MSGVLFCCKIKGELEKMSFRLAFFAGRTTMTQPEQNRPAWSIPEFLELKDNTLHIGGASAVELAERYGTPLFVFSERRIKQNIARLRRAENPGSHYH